MFSLHIKDGYVVNYYTFLNQLCCATVLLTGSYVLQYYLCFSCFDKSKYLFFGCPQYLKIHLLKVILRKTNMSYLSLGCSLFCLCTIFSFQMLSVVHHTDLSSSLLPLQLNSL